MDPEILKRGRGANLAKLLYPHDHCSKKGKIGCTPLYSNLTKYRKNGKLATFLMETSFINKLYIISLYIVIIYINT